MALTNVEGLLVAAIKADAAVSQIAGARVYVELPASKTWPAVRVTRFGGDMAVPRVLDSPDVQLDVWAPRKAEAFTLASAVVDVVERLPLMGVLPLGVVTGSEIRQVSYAPDDVFDPAIPRYIIDAHLWAHRIHPA